MKNKTIFLIGLSIVWVVVRLGRGKVITEISGICAFNKCRRKAIEIASGEGEDAEPRTYCGEHAEIIWKQGQHIAIADCPNCHCGFGVWPEAGGE